MNTIKTSEVLDLTIAQVGKALANDNHWLKPDSEEAVIIRKAVELGWVIQISHSQYQWKSGVLDGTLYLVDSEEFRGSIQNETYYKAGAIRAGYTDHQPYWEYVAEYKEKYGKDLILITSEQLDVLVEAFTNANSTSLVEITEEEFEDMLDCLPPLKMKKEQGVFMFVTCEATWGPLHSHFAQYDNKCYTGLRSCYSKLSDFAKEVIEKHGTESK